MKTNSLTSENEATNIKGVKVLMNLSPKSKRNIEELTSLFNEKNKTRVVALSLEIAKSIMLHKQNGRKIIVRGEDGSELLLDFIIS